ncbi:uncharacterized protein N7484_003054 [Penicillium longicatenatum]|uniref:uncharacterized protein n=1 Tax=Penicillium longicatenatum TaxID=1561947 RepID=UPI0025485B1A|nr:uncharacterized protein N7484_003054 [Penicillium longicatenatum]KAJ5649331.1 hypothetical protein N7484_003054 [Penicillium longicatenatum]
MADKTSSEIVPGAPWVLIAVMGVTGAGKSTFIQTASQSPEVVVGHSLESCTSEMRGYTLHYKGYNINLIDTPGFNDTNKSETEVLRDIAEWLRGSYECQQKLHGVIYLHSINNPRMEGSALRNLRMFRQLCGEEPLKNVILGTTFWGRVNEQTGTDREAELRERPEFWGQMIQRGSRMMRVTDRASTLRIVEHFIPLKPVPLEIQLELVDQAKPLIETAAGKSVNEELLRLEEMHKEELRKIREEYTSALEEMDKDLQETLAQHERKHDADLDRVYRQQEQLRAERRADHRKWQNDLEMLPKRVRESSSGGSDTDECHKPSELQDMSFDELVGKIRANEIKIKAEDRDKVESIILKVQKKSDLSSLFKSKMKGTSGILLAALQLLIPVASLLLLGVPVALPSTGN